MTVGRGLPGGMGVVLPVRDRPTCGARQRRRGRGRRAGGGGGRTAAVVSGGTDMPLSPTKWQSPPLPPHCPSSAPRPYMPPCHHTPPGARASVKHNQSAFTAPGKPTAGLLVRQPALWKTVRRGKWPKLSVHFIALCSVPCAAS